MYRLILFLFIICASPARGDEFLTWQGSDSYDFSVQGGPFLPFKIAGVIDNLMLSGVTVSHPTPVTRVEYGVLQGRGGGVTMYNGFVSLRMDFQALEYVNGFLSLGGDYYYYRPRGISWVPPYRSKGGAHIGFGGIVDLAGSLKLRTDFKLNNGPGRSLYVGLGLAYEFGGSQN